MFHNHKQQVVYRKRVDTENEKIMNNLLTTEQLRRKVIERMWYYGKHYSIGEDLRTIDRKRLKKLMRFRMDYIKLTTLGKAAVFIMTSYPESMTALDKYGIQIVPVSERVLPKSVVIIGSHSPSVYANPLVACPIIPKESFNDFCHRYRFDLSTICFDKSRPYPFIDM